MTWRSFVSITQTKASDPVVQVSSNNPQLSSPETPVTTDQEIRITDSCWRRIRALTDESNFLRIFVDAGGCSGFTYQFEIDSNIETDDIIFENGSSRLVVDTDTLDLIRGSRIDFVEEMIKSSFEVSENPQSESACGCGSSFAVKNFAANSAKH